MDGCLDSWVDAWLNRWVDGQMSFNVDRWAMVHGVAKRATE